MKVLAGWQPCPPLRALAGTLQPMLLPASSNRGTVQSSRQAAGCAPSQQAELGCM